VHAATSFNGSGGADVRQACDEDLLVTLQIGLVGDEGIVLASDCCMSVSQKGTWLTTQRSKFVRSRNHIFAFAGDDLAENVAKRLSLELDSNPIRDPHQAAIDIINNYSNKLVAPGSIIGIARGRLWLSTFGLVSGAYPGGEIGDKYVTGDSANAAGFFAQRYYADCRRTLSGLKRLAAHVICVGSKLNPAGIQGLEMVIWDRGTDTLSPVSDAEIATLKGWSEHLDNQIESALR
jgi:hypothetical protein